jgi:hypothetical protein
MKNISISIFILLVLCNACKENLNNKSEDLKSVNNQSPDSILGIIQKRFGVLTGQQNNDNDNSFLSFYCFRSYDSSFLINIKEEQNHISGVYYVEMPRYYNLDDFGVEQNFLIFFHGYSFNIDSMNWQLIKRKTLELLKDSTFKVSAGCRDCKQYGLTYNNKNKIDNGLKLEPYYNFLKETFLTKLINKRKL